MLKRFVRVCNDSRGATAVEYGLLAALIAVAAIASLRTTGTKLRGTFSNVSNAL
ncbi:Flp family type IVb pilin [Sphingomonas daechungensis]|uniref:Flp family type IVb pilin n=1 Tax=Sphingomonas daechungensis TaxID=1176646 RepID=UPI0031E81FFC